MKIVGLITEYNPFHKGHEYHIEEALRMTGADKAIVVMSGDFVQRGEPAIMPKHHRAKMALEFGVSLVLELPIRYATGSAEYFATGAVDLLHQLGCVDYLCFGSECGDIAKLESIASVLLQEPREYKTSLANHLKLGVSFPKARQLALEEYSVDYNIDGSILADPNNILGVEYLKALYKLNSLIKPYTIKRETNNYHDEELGAIHSSATSIRKYLYEGNQKLDVLSNQLPKHVFDIMTDQYKQSYPIYIQDFSLLLHHKLLTSTSQSLATYLDVTPELASRIIKHRNQFMDMEQFIELIKSKHITRSRVSRCLLHILLQIPQFELGSMSIHTPYARVLGFRKDDSRLLTEITNTSNIPLITKLSQSFPTLDKHASTLLNEDIQNSNLYELISSHKFKHSYIPEPQKTMIII